MKNKKVLLSIIGIIIVSVLLVVIVKNNTKEYIMYDGSLLALTIDGAPATSFPSDTSKYHVDIECENGVGQYLPIKEDSYNLKFIIKNITKDGVKCFIDFTTITDSNKSGFLLKTKVEEVNTTNNNGYRYSGKEPENFVWFNNEKWRIIGSIPTTLEDGETVENRVKIIRAESIGGLVYHSSNSNTTWGSGNTLYTLLNSYYYGKLDATGSSPCLGYSGSTYALCNYTDIGISSSSTDYYGRMVIDVYMNAGTVGSTSTKIDASYTLEAGTLTSNTAKIGLMSASDYGYATSGITYSSVGLSSLDSYEQNNWLYGQSYEWTMTPNSTSSVLHVHDYGSLGDIFAIYGVAVRPVLYLDSNVYIISGDGTESSPFILGM